MWRIVGASAVGTSHTGSNTPCQDANLFFEMAGGVALAAVADGLGSAGYSHVGSRLAVEKVLDTLKAELSDDPVPARDRLEQHLQAKMAKAFAAARTALEGAAERESIPLRELGTTLLAVACGPDWLVSGHVGDGAVISYWDGELATVSEPERGEYANITVPLTMEGALERVRYAFAPRAPQAVVLMSDGLQALALNTRDNTPFEGFLRPLIDGVNQFDGDEKATEALVAFMESDRVNARTDDDKTLVIVSRVAPALDDEAETIAIQILTPPPTGPVLLPAPSPPNMPERRLPAPQHPPKRAVASTADPPAGENDASPPTAEAVKPVEISRAEQLESEALALEEEAGRLDEEAQERMAGFVGQVSKKEWNVVKSLRDLADERRKDAKRKREQAQRVRAAVSNSRQ
jgi:hypothetical protein